MDGVVTLSLTATLMLMTCGLQLNAETLQIGTYVEYRNVLCVIAVLSFLHSDI